MAEKFGFDEFGGQARAINLQERRVVALSLLVNPASELVFAGAAFAGDEKRCARIGNFVGKLEDALRGGAFCHPGNSRVRRGADGRRSGGVAHGCVVPESGALGEENGPPRDDECGGTSSGEGISARGAARQRRSRS